MCFCSVLLVKLLVLSILQDHWLSTRELLTELVGIVIQAITVIVVAVSILLSQEDRMMIDILLGA